MHFCLLLLGLVVSQGPAPPPSNVGDSVKQQATGSQLPATPEQRGTEQSPLVVKILTSPKAKPETTEEAAQSDGKTANDRHIVYLTGALALIALLQLLVYAYQAKKLRETVDSAKSQSEAMDRHITEASRSATAMETIAANIQSGNHAVLRAYVSVVVGTAAYQERPNTKFAGSPTVINSGFTQARNVRIQKRAAILTVPPPEDFAFLLPPINPQDGHATIGAHQPYTLTAVVDDFVEDAEIDSIKKGVEKAVYVWGLITYDDIFGEEHHTRFGQVLFWIPDGKIFGNYIPGQNDAD